MTEDLMTVGVENELATTPADEILAETDVSTNDGPSAGFIAGAAAVGAAIGVAAVELGKFAVKKGRRWWAIQKAKKEAGKAAAQAYDAAEEETNRVMEAAKKGGNKR